MKLSNVNDDKEELEPFFCSFFLFASKLFKELFFLFFALSFALFLLILLGVGDGVPVDVGVRVAVGVGVGEFDLLRTIFALSILGFSNIASC